MLLDPDSPLQFSPGVKGGYFPCNNNDCVDFPVLFSYHVEKDLRLEFVSSSFLHLSCSP